MAYPPVQSSYSPATGSGYNSGPSTGAPSCGSGSHAEWRPMTNRWECVADVTPPATGPARPGQTGGGAAPIQCEPWQTPYNSPVTGWRCVGNNPDDYAGGGGGEGGGGGGFNYEPPVFGGSARPDYNFGPAPMFDAPSFIAPTAEDLYKDPSYQFRLDEGRNQLEASAAARGVTRTGNNLQGILEYGQKFASQEWSNAFDRALQKYDRDFQEASSEFAPKFTEWQTLTAAEQRGAELGWQREWDEYIFAINDQFRREEMIFNAGTRDL